MSLSEPRSAQRLSLRTKTSPNCISLPVFRISQYTAATANVSLILVQLFVLGLSRALEKVLACRSDQIPGQRE